LFEGPERWLRFFDLLPTRLPETITLRVYEYGEKWFLRLWKLGSHRLHIPRALPEPAIPSDGCSEDNETHLAIVTERGIPSRHLLLRNGLQVLQVFQGNHPCPDILPIVGT